MSSERSSWRLLGHESASTAVLAAGTGQAIGKRLSGRLNRNSVAPEFTPKHNSELSDNRARRPHDAVPFETGEYEGAAAALGQALLRSSDATVAFFLAPGASVLLEGVEC
jgi:hypothetical protein